MKSPSQYAELISPAVVDTEQVTEKKTEENEDRVMNIHMRR